MKRKNETKWTQLFFIINLMADRHLKSLVRDAMSQFYSSILNTKTINIYVSKIRLFIRGQALLLSEYFVLLESVKCSFN
jgi:hypothetical protein